jgi:hypothetical protein
MVTRTQLISDNGHGYDESRKEEQFTTRGGRIMERVTEQDVETAEEYAETMKRALEAWRALPSRADIEKIAEWVQSLAEGLEQALEVWQQLPSRSDIEEIAERTPQGLTELLQQMGNRGEVFSPADLERVEGLVVATKLRQRMAGRK